MTGPRIVVGRVLAIGGLVLASQAFTAPTQTVSGKADHGVVAGTINGNVTVGYTAEQMRRALAAARSDPALADQARKLGVAEGAFAAFFVIVGENNVPPDQYEAKLIEYAGRYKDLQKSVAAVPDAASPQIAALKAQAEEATNTGKFDDADRLLQQIEAAQDAALRSQLADRSATATSRAKIAMTQLRYRDAALQFVEAAQRAPDDETKLVALDAEADAYFRQGDEFGDNDALATAIVRFENLITLHPRTSVPLEWARSQVNLGNALAMLGERQPDTESLKRSVEVFGNALLENTRDRVPLEWARTEVDLGVVLVALAEREIDTKSLERAVCAFKAALEEERRGEVPSEWVSAHLDLGVALERLGERKGDIASLNKAVDAFTAVLSKDTRNREPMLWAKAQVDLGNALERLGERGGDAKHFIEAVAAFDAALEVETQQRVPLLWAAVQADLGIALEMLGDLNNDTKILESSAGAFEFALKEFSRDRAPQDWATAKNDLGNVFADLGERESGTDRLDQAVCDFSDALSVRTRDSAPQKWAKTQIGLADAEFQIALRRHDAQVLLALEAKLADARLVALQGGDERLAAYAKWISSEIAVARAKMGG